MKNLLDLLKDAGFSRRSLAQAAACGIALAVFASVATNLAAESAPAVAAGGFVVALLAIAAGKTVFGLLRGGSGANDQEDEE